MVLFKLICLYGIDEFLSLNHIHNLSLGRKNLGTVLEMRCGSTENDGALIYKIDENEVLSENEQVFMERLNNLTKDNSGSLEINKTTLSNYVFS